MTPEESPADNKENTEPESDAPEQEADPAATDTEAVPDSENTPDPEQAEGEPDAPDAADAAAAPDMETLEAEVADLNDKLLRALAETENIRRRAERDKGDASKYAIANFAREMLSVGDNLRRALGTVESDVRKENPVIEQLMVGLEMTDREIQNTFERFGIKGIEAMGEKFDHNLHEAMFEIDDPAKPAGTVVQVVETGYVLKDRLLRPAKVGVSKGGPQPDKNALKDTAAAEASPTDDSSEQKEGQTAYEDKGGEPGAQLDEEL